MASRDDDFNLIGHENGTSHVPPHSPTLHRFSPKSPPPPPQKSINNELADDEDHNNIQTFHPFSTDEEDPDPTPNPPPDKQKEIQHEHNGEYRVEARPDYRKDREEWSDTAINSLLDAYTDKYVQLNRGNLRGRDWEEVASTVSMLHCKSVEQCKNKVDNLKKRYKVERNRMQAYGVTVSHWPWFKKMQEIVGHLGSAMLKSGSDDDKSWSGSAVVLTPSKRYSISIPSPVGLTNNTKSKSLANPRWRRVIFKISGTALAGNEPQKIDPKVAMLIAREVSVACRLGVEWLAGAGVGTWVSHFVFLRRWGSGLH